jgi:2'-5' RNA ligase
MEIRSFLAFELPEDIKKIVTRVSGEIRKSSLDVRWVRPEFIHLTVVFMGDIQSEQIPSMGEVLSAVCSSYKGFRISLKPLGCFPNSRSPRVIWLGIDGDLERMSRFRDDLQHALSPFGIKEEERALEDSRNPASGRRNWNNSLRSTGTWQALPAPWMNWRCSGAISNQVAPLIQRCYHGLFQESVVSHQ